MLRLGSRRIAVTTQQSRDISHAENLLRGDGISKAGSSGVEDVTLQKGTSQVRKRSLFGVPVPPKLGTVHL
jgi:hypothetical protein